ncbi:MAG: hypothetical protein II936_08910, partial [Oscillospiraceae bacterium]|nr:hypothetical protein [Oscillospiraceae bacterium]
SAVALSIMKGLRKRFHIYSAEKKKKVGYPGTFLLKIPKKSFPYPLSLSNSAVRPIPVKDAIMFSSILFHISISAA